MSNHDCCGLGKTQKQGKRCPRRLYRRRVPQKKMRFKCPYLYEGRKKNDSWSIVSCIYVENIEIKTKKQSELARIHCGLSILHIEREIIIFTEKLTKSARSNSSYDRLSLMIVSTVRLQNDNILIVSNKFRDKIVCDIFGHFKYLSQVRPRP